MTLLPLAPTSDASFEEELKLTSFRIPPNGDGRATLTTNMASDPQSGYDVKACAKAITQNVCTKLAPQDFIHGRTTPMPLF